MADSGSYTPETIASRQKIADQLLMQAVKPREIRHWAQGLGQLGEAALGGYLGYKAEEEQKQGTAAQAAAIASLLSGGSPSNAAPSAAPSAAPELPTSQAAGPPTSDFMPNVGSLPPSPMDANAKAIASIESGGAYDKLGPVTKGDRAYGKYQVMGSNVGPWTKAHLGREMTPEQFLADPAAQDAVFKGQFGQYAQKYGPEGAARAWFAGEGGMNDMGRKDVLGTSVADYAAKFNKGVGAQPTSQASPVAAALAQPQQVAQNASTALPGVPSDNRAAIAKMLNDPNPYVRKMGIQLGQGIIQKQLEGEKPTDEMREYQLYRQQGGKDSFFDYKSGLKRAGAQNTVINNTVNPILKGVGDRFNETMDTARAAIPQIEGIHEARKALDQGAFTGTGADPKLFLAKAGNLFGLTNEQASNTEVLRSSIGSQVLAKAKTLGANPSNTDRDYIEKVVGGKIELEEKTIRRLLDMQEKWARDAIKRANADGSQVLKAQPKELEAIAPLLSVQEPVSYEEFLKKNPIVQSAPAQPRTDLKKKYGLD